MKREQPLNSKLKFIGAAGIYLAAALGTEAYAVCTLRSSSGKCLFWSGSVDCENLNATGVGNVTKDPKSLQCKVDPPLNATNVPVIVFCSNNGGNVAPGVNGVLDSGFSGFATIFPSQVDRNGNVKGINVKAQANATQLAQVTPICQNALNVNWYAIDIVPASASVAVKLVDDVTGLPIDEAKFDCVLPNPSTLGWDKRAGKPERRQYNCTRQP
jgi:hypothetical protein